MKVTFVLAQADLSGGVRVVSIYADRLKRRGHDVSIVVRPHRQPTLRETFKRLAGRALPSAARAGPTHLDDLDVEVNYVDSFRPITGTDVPDADVVVATWWETAEWVENFPESKGAKAYFIQHYEVHAGQPIARVERTWRLPMHKITISQWLVNLARDKFNDPVVSLVPNAVDLEQFHAGPRGKQTVPTVGVMYSVVPFKGCEVSLKAVDLASRVIPKLRLVSFGYRDPSPELPLPPGARFVKQPPQDELKDIYSQCDAWLFSSRSEGFGLPLLEAMACRTPVIATPAGAAQEVCAGGGGILVPRDDAAHMARAIEKIVGMPDADWRQMSDRAYATVSGYNWDEATDRFEAALRLTVERNRKGELAPAATAI
ncbi:MAG TPA: glycosyltransferase family 4 protein [Tepidisphaeraceae bacterium]|nr:glycosyltransferase family 4 protein [Tepidisphaeraceae bacterium]